ncbi:MAG: universal stress protein, partial [Lachnospiraceae bacterium]|nr:universal stress protein [Lachnospiraceae bacterium]
MEENNSYFNNLLKNSKTTKKQVALYLDESKIERIDMVVKLFSSISDSKSFSRNTLIEEAIDKFLNESEKFLQEKHGISVNELLEEARSEQCDTVILSSHGRRFEEAFLGEGEEACWYPCRISDARESSLKYIAIYCG